MPIDIEEVLQRAFEQAFLNALDAIVKAQAEELFKKFLAPGTPLAKKLEDKIEKGFQFFLDDGIRWEKRKAGYKK